jgi:hypothetical protein
MPQIKAVQLFSDCLALKMQAVNFLRTSVTIYQETQHHTPADLDLRQHHCDHLKCQSDTDVILWPSTHFTQYKHLQLKILNQHLNCQEQWNGRLAVICIYLLNYLYIQIVFSRMHPPTHRLPYYRTLTQVRWNSNPQLPLHMHVHYFIWQLQAATSWWFACCINLAQLASEWQGSRWKWQTIAVEDLLR